MTTSRRSFLKGVSAAGAAAAAAQFVVPATSGAAPARVRTTREDHRVVIVGSGFGGGVASLRLAQAGVDVLVLERGRRWRAGPNSTTFPRASAPDKRILWHVSTGNLLGRELRVEPYVGLIEAVAGENMTALCPAGVGGGSLVYQGMTLQPAEHVFNTHFPEALDWQTMNRVHYPRVARMLQVAVAPDVLVNTPRYAAAREFAKRVRRAGFPLSKIPMPIDWRYAIAETEGKMRAAYTSGDGAMGVNNAGKHSVDVTYIKQGEATGRVTVATQHNVTSIARRGDGRWTVEVDRTDETGAVVERKILTTQALILSAGSVNSTKLLLRARERGTITDLPDGIGSNWGTNADRIYVWSRPDPAFGPLQGGPVVYGSKNWDDPELAYTFIQASIPPMLAGADLHSTMLVGFGASRGRGTIGYDAPTGRAIVRWPREGDHVVQNTRIHPAISKVVGTDLLIDTNAVVPSTWHALGGASMGIVCDLDGRVRGQQGLYVLDGAIMPGNTAACNPSMTIAAVAERALDRIVATDVGTVI